MYIGPGSDVLSADKLSLGLKFNPWDTAITCQPDWRSMSKSVFTPCDPLESWYTEQSDVLFEDVKNVLPPTNAPCDRCSSVFSFTAEHRQFVTLNKKQKNEISNGAAFITETNQVMWSVLTNTIPHGRTIMYMVTPATEASMMSIGHFSEIFDPGKNGLQLFDDSLMRLMNDFASKDRNVVSSYVPFQDDDMERFVEMCSFEMFLLQTVNMNDKVIITADTRHLQRWAEHKVDPVLCAGDIIAFFCVCLAILENLRLWTHERTPDSPRNEEDLESIEFAGVLGAIAENDHLTRCAQVCFTGTEEDPAERHERLTKFCEIKTWNKEKTSWMKLTEKFVSSHRYLFLVSWSPRKNVVHPAFVFLAMLAFR